RRIADARRKMLHVMRQIVARGFLTRLNQDDAASMGKSLLGQRQDRAKGGEKCVAIIGAAAPIELVTLQPRDPRSIALEPTSHRTLLVDMTVERHSLSLSIWSGPIPLAAARWNFDQDHRCAAWQAHNLQCCAKKLRHLRFCPAGEKIDRLVHKAMGGPVAI